MYVKKGQVWENCRTGELVYITHINSTHEEIHACPVKMMHEYNGNKVVKLKRFLEKYKYSHIFRTLYMGNRSRIDIRKIMKISKSIK